MVSNTLCPAVNISGFQNVYSREEAITGHFLPWAVFFPFWALPAGSEALRVGSEALPAGSEAHKLALRPTQLFSRPFLPPQRPFMLPLWPTSAVVTVIVPYRAAALLLTKFNINETREAEGTADHATLLRLFHTSFPLIL